MALLFFLESIFANVTFTNITITTLAILFFHPGLAKITAANLAIVYGFLWKSLRGNVKHIS